MNVCRTTTGIIAAIAFIMLGQRASAVTRYVDLNSTNPVSPFTNRATAAVSIQQAVDAAVDGDTVLITNGTYHLTAPINVTKGIELQGINGAEQTIVDGGNSNRCFLLDHPDCAVSGLSIVNGLVFSENGGGIYCSSTNPVINHCIIQENSTFAGSGGGIYGGTVNHSTIIGNHSPHGAGGGMANCIANNCRITGNSASSGGGALNVTANNSLISYNTAADDDGGASGGRYNNCTIIENVSDQGTGGVGSAYLINCIVWNNTSLGGGNDNLNIPTFFPFPFYILNSCSPEVTHGQDGNITNAPKFTVEGRIAFDSPCIGAGTNITSGTDIDGDPWNNPPAIGCDEPSEFLTGPLAVKLSDLPDRVFTGKSVSLFAYTTGKASMLIIDFGDGEIATNMNAVAHAWSGPGTYTVTATAFNEDYTNGVSTADQIRVYAEGAPIYVASNGDDANSGQSWAEAKATIQAGMDEQWSDGGSIILSNGTYRLTAEIVVTNHFVIQGQNGPDVTIIDGGGSNRCFYLDHPDCAISGLTVMNGVSERHGGGVYCSSDSIVITNCIIRDNKAKNAGGGIYRGTADHCVIMNNRASWEGGGMFRGTAYSCTFMGNSASAGGGMFSSTAYNCTISGNVAPTGGGISGGQAENCIVWYNTGGDIAEGTAASFTCSPDVIHGINGNITNAPLLTSGSHIALNSPCLGAGTNRTTGTDIDGEPWKNPPAMGCDEPGNALAGPLDLGINGLPAQVAENFEVDFYLAVTGAGSMTIIDSGDGQSQTNRLGISHRWNTAGSYDVVLTAYNTDYPGGLSVTQQIAVVPADGMDVYVALDGNDANSGTNWAEAKATIQAGVDAQSLYGGTVWISNGTYHLTSEISVSNNIIVQGFNGPGTTLIEGGQSNRCFNLYAPKCVISGLTVTNGYPSSEIYSSGGGIYCQFTTPVVTNCIISGNKAYLAGGGMTRGVAKNCIFTGNTAIAGFDWTSSGGGMWGGTAYNCLFSKNQAFHGGGMANGTANNCTFISNSAYADGGGIDSGRINNCIVWHNGNGNSIIGTDVFNSCSPNVNHGMNGNITNAPLFIDEAAGNYRLQSNSPCINWGNNAYASGHTDLDGNPRIIGTHVDMGAYEYQTDPGDDADRDGMSDAWERTYLGYNSSPSENTDGDRCSNGDEFTAGTDPTNAASMFIVTNITPIAEGFVLNWDAVTGRVYSVMWTDSLTNGFQSLETGIHSPQSSYTDSVHIVEDGGFYQLTVERIK